MTGPKKFCTFRLSRCSASRYGKRKMYCLLSDTHFNHAMLVEKGYRPAGFENRFWRDLQNARSFILIHLGDVSIGLDRETHERFIRESPAKQNILIRGNHDGRSAHWYLERGWDHVSDGMILYRFGLKILFTHRPVEVPDWIDVNVHGHLHSGVHRGPEWDDGKHVHISCEELGYQPIPLHQALEKLKK